MDYDKTSVPGTYDAGRETSAEEKAAFLGAYASKTGTSGIDHIIDLGCGTGRYSQSLAEIFHADVLGIEPSERMRAQAEAKTTSPRVRFAPGSGEHVPSAAGSADLIFMSMVIHHLPDLAKTTSECARVLKSGGFVCIWNTVSDEAGTYPYLNVFPSIRGIIESKLTARGQLDETFADAGFDLFNRDIVPHVVATDWRVLADKMALRADSFVAQLPQAEFEAGLNALRRLAEHDEGRPSTLQVDRIIYRRR